MPGTAWAWHLTPIAGNGTRLVTRVHAVYNWRHPLTAVLGMLLTESGDFAMMRRMLRGIKSEPRASSVTPTAGCPARADQDLRNGAMTTTPAPAIGGSQT